ncbi:MAG: hypothetical protein KDC06_11895, partial [Chitinophagaceae bacterium]|nr:hypothetical protein [Chitinophagaceae bacterium]
MQPNFTLKKFAFSGLQIVAVLLLIGLTTQTTLAQNKNSNPFGKRRVIKENPDMLKAKQAYVNALRNQNPSADNDAGLPNGSVQNLNSSNLVCGTIVGSIALSDPALSSRINRNGVQGTCASPKPYAGDFSSGSFRYKTYTYTNTSGIAQCATFTCTNNDAAANLEFAVYTNSFNPADKSANFLTDPGVSSGIPPSVTTCSANIAAGANLVFLVFTANSDEACTGFTIDIDMPLCSSAPCSGTPDPGPTLSSVSNVCPTVPFTLSLTNSTPGAGVTYQWQSAASTSGPWADIGGATNPSLVTSQTATTSYQCVVTCTNSGNSGTSVPVEVVLNPPSACYCDAGASST